MTPDIVSRFAFHLLLAVIFKAMKKAVRNVMYSVMTVSLLCIMLIQFSGRVIDNPMSPPNQDKGVRKLFVEKIRNDTVPWKKKRRKSMKKEMYPKPKLHGSNNNSKISRHLVNLQNLESIQSFDCLSWKLGDSHEYVLPRNAKKIKLETMQTQSEDNEHRKESFKKIFKTNAWGKSKSGPGSFLSATKRIRAILDSVIEQLKTYLNKDKLR